MSNCKILLSGANGRLGRAIIAAASDDLRVVAGIDPNPAVGELPIYRSINDLPELDIDCIVDCSHHTAAIPLLEYAKEKKLPIVICTTGHTEEETAAIHAAAAQIPVFYSRNMSVGINLIIALARKAAAMLGEDFDIEIIEKHHNKKLDAPSGTALMIADAISNTVDYEPEYVYERQSKRVPREKNEIGIHSIRGGTIVGEHEVIFAGKDEVVTIAHSAASREVFAQGAIRAAKYICDKAPGFYNMETMLDF